MDASLPVTLAAEFPQSADVAAVQTKLASLINDLADDAKSLGDGCTAYAGNVDEIRGELLAMLGQLALEVAIDIGVGVALSFFTFGAGALAGAAKAATTIARWIPKIAAVLRRLKTLIMTARRTMAVMRRAAIEAIESAVSGTIANAGASLTFGNFSWDGLAGAAISGGAGGAIAGPFSHIGSNITSRGTRITVRASVDGVTGGVGGVGGEFLASQVTGQEFNMLMAALVGTAGGTAGGGLTSIRNPGSSVNASVPTGGAPSVGGTTNVTPAVVGAGSTGGAPSAGGTGAAGGPSSGGAPSAGGTPSADGAPAATGTPSAGGGSGAPAGGGTGGAPSAGGAPAAGGGDAGGGAGAGATDVPQSTVEVPASLPQDTPTGTGGGTQADGPAAVPTTDIDAGGTGGAEATTIPDTNVDVPTSLANDAPAGGPGAEGPAANTVADTGGVPASDVNNTDLNNTDLNNTDLNNTDVNNTDHGGRTSAAGGAGAVGAGTAHPDGPAQTTPTDGTDGVDNTDAPDGSDGTDGPENSNDGTTDSDMPPADPADDGGVPAGDENGPHQANDVPPPAGPGQAEPSSSPENPRDPAQLIEATPEGQTIIAGTELSGNGWKRVNDARFDEPGYGGVIPESGPIADRFVPDVTTSTHPDTGAVTVTADNPGSAFLLLGGDPNAPFGYHPETRNPMTRTEWESRNVDVNPKNPSDPGQMHWSPNDGSVIGTRVRFTDLGEFQRVFSNLPIDRVGGKGGSYMGIGGGTINERALAPNQVQQSQYQEVHFVEGATLPEGWSLEISLIGEAYGLDGGGLQLVIRDGAGEGVKLNHPAVEGIFKLEDWDF